ncbi:uncharacterized protein LOC142332953 [Lycorma delicatula]|uniref:uncharacterized protein LOC142332953 n=1 Tax=Lycorma delicatula TaxID=130591 RepID=UPI003F51661A
MELENCKTVHKMKSITIIILILSINTISGLLKKVEAQQQISSVDQYSSSYLQPVQINTQYNSTNMASYQTPGIPPVQYETQYQNFMLPPGGYPPNTNNGQYQNPDLYNNLLKQESLTPCICGVFLSGQISSGSGSQPAGNPVLTHEQEEAYSCNSSGNKQCTNKCLDVLVKHLSNSPTIICGSIDRDCYKERAYLWIKNCNSTWVNSNLSAGREYCCKGGMPYKCPLIS